LHDFNREFCEPTPEPEVLAERLRTITTHGDTVVLLAGEPSVAVAVLRFRKAIWTDTLECYLAEFFVVPEQRRRGIGRTLLRASIDVARERGASTMEIGVDGPDTGARALYEAFGFSNRVGDAGDAVMYVYERDI
jgi:ribosomal protein S18 acetylase RimI-like enzyme